MLKASVHPLSGYGICKCVLLLFWQKGGTIPEPNWNPLESLSINVEHIHIRATDQNLILLNSCVAEMSRTLQII